METVDVERTFRGRTQPHVVIHSGRNGAVGNNRQGWFSILVSPDFYRADASYISGFQEISSFVPVRVAALPLSYLDHPVVFAGRLFHQVAFFDRVGKRFFHINVFPCLAGIDGRQAMPMVGSSDNDCIYVLIVDHLTPVLVEVGDLLPGTFFHISSSFVQPFVVDIAESYALHFGILQEITQIGESHRTASYQGYLHFVAWSSLSENRSVCTAE